ncbi:MULTISPECIES: hypothetical protein [Frankia]|uniref:hypothetical protein n=1 Tax=Frankia TaxID=1854 RepID=UPI000698359F|nr:MULTISPECIES: hypothetical protein [Frankia]
MPSFGDPVHLAAGHSSGHGTGGNRVAFDPARLHTLAAAVRSAGEALHTGARIVAHALAQVGGPAGWAARLARLGDELDADAAMLRRRLALAEGADDAGRSLLPSAAIIAPAVQHSRSLLDNHPGLATQPGPAAQPVIATGSLHGAVIRPDSDADADADADDGARPSDGAGPGADTAAGFGAVPVAGGGPAARAAGRTAARSLLSGGSPAGADDAAGRPAGSAGRPARANGAGAGRRLGSPGGHAPGGGDAPAASLREAVSALRTRGRDPDFVAGFYDALGPAGLARLLAGVAGRSRGPMVNRPAPPSGVNRRDAEEILGRTFAAYSRGRTLDDSWLGRFNTRGRHDRAETVLLTPLLTAGRIDGALLDRLGRLAFGPGSGPAVRRAPADGQVAGVLRNATADRGYRVALLAAIAGEPGLAARFATRYVKAVLAGAAVADLDLPVAVGLDDATARAWSGLLAAAGGPAARRADPRGSADFVARLAGAVHAADGPALPPHLRAAFVPALHTYLEEMYDAVTAVVPGPVSPATTASAARQVPVAAWRALLRESLRGGALAGMLGRDAAAYAIGVDERVAGRTRGWNAGAGGYPSSPRALGYLRGARAQAFFTDALGDAADAVLREHADAGSAHRRRQAVILDLLGTVVTSIDPTDPVATFTHLGVGITVDMVEALVRQRYRDVSTTRPAWILARLREASRLGSGWAAAYEASARQLWARRGEDPLRPITVTDSDGRRRVYTGDPRVDGYITGPTTDFLDATGDPRPSAAMTPAQRGAYLAWLESPALVANNDRLPVLAGAAALGETRVPPDEALRPSG